MANEINQVSPNTYGTLKTTPLGNAANIRQIWQKGALLAEQSTDFFQEMESKSDRGIIWTQTDLSKGNGSIMNFTTQSGFYKLPKLGDALFETSADFDVIRQSNFQLTVDFARWAVRTNKRMEEMMGMRGDIESGVNVELGKNLGRFKTEQVLGMCLHKLPAENITYANGRALNTIRTADIFKWDEAVKVGQAMRPMGGLPANVAGRGSKDEIWSQTFVAATPAITSLKLDSGWRDVLKNGDIRGGGNTIFKGGFPSIDGHTIVPYNPVDHDGIGPMGSFLNPKAFLGEVIAPGTAVIAVKGGGSVADNAASDYFRYFDGAPYSYIDTGAITPEATLVKYFIIYNITGADAGKWGMYAYTSGNIGTQITITARLAAANGAGGADVKHTILGGTGNTNGIGGTYTANAIGTQWNALLNTADHPLGSLIIPCNSLGVPIGDTLAFGRAGILRGYGEFRAEHTTDLLNGKFVQDRYLTSVFGQTFRKDRKDRVTSVMRIRHAVTYPGINLPIIT